MQRDMKEENASKKLIEGMKSIHVWALVKWSTGMVTMTAPVRCLAGAQDRQQCETGQGRGKIMWKIEITTLRHSIATFKQNEPLNKQAYIVDGKMDRLICKHGSTHIGQTN